MRPPRKPFPKYKWRWAVYTPTESLNDPPVYLGILRVLRDNEFEKFSSSSVNEALQVVQQETESTVNLVRSPERNIFRNSGQYWRGLGMLAEGTKGQIILTNFGRKFADGEITQVEFASTIIKTFQLPNRRIDNDTSDWDQANLTIKPFEIILNIISRLQEMFGIEQGYISIKELIKIVIPLAGDNGTINDYVKAINLFRQNRIDLSNWPDCAPESNDRRMAREFMLYLSNYGLCKCIPGRNNMDEKYFLGSISTEEVNELFSIQTQETELDRIERIIKSSQIPANIERKRVVREILERPNQNAFRRIILEAYQSTCLITGVRIETVLEAAHIKPVKYHGSDDLFNGICMRADIHALFDSNNLRIKPNGDIVLSNIARRRENYALIPERIDLPTFIDPQQLDWRLKYY